MTFHQLILAVAVFSVGVHVLMMASFLWLTWRAKREPARPAALGRVSILKPLAGADEDLEANLESFAHLEGADYEVLLGVASLDDPAVPLARRFLLRHPTLHARLVLTDPGAALNPKVAQLLALQEAAVGEVFVISDSNVRVPPDYLMQLMGELARPGVGLVSSVLAGTGETTFAAAVENLFIATHVAPGVVSAARVAGRPISMGKSMAMRRVDLARTGGFEAVANLLAEDHALGRRFHACGMGVRVCLKPVENRNVTGKLSRTLDRHTRWAQIRRTMAPTGLFFEPLLMPALVVPLLAFLSPSRPLAWLALGSVVVRILDAQLSLKVLRGRAQPLKLWPLELLRSLMMAWCWVRAWSTLRVEWRGHQLRIGKDTLLLPAGPRTLDRVLALVRG